MTIEEKVKLESVNIKMQQGETLVDETVMFDKWVIGLVKEACAKQRKVDREIFEDYHSSMIQGDTTPGDIADMIENGFEPTWEE